MSNAGEWGAGRRERRLQPFASFQYRNYRWLWAANLSNGVVESAQRFALIWLALDTLDGGSRLTGLVALAALVAPLVLALPAGVLADRKDRRLILAASHILVAVALVVGAILSGAGVVTQGLVVLVAFLIGVGAAIGEPVRAALIPAVVPASRLLNANALYLLGRGLGAIVGPVLVGVTISASGMGSALVVLAAVMLGGALFLKPLRLPSRESVPSPQQAAEFSERLAPGGMLDDIGEGYRFVTSRWSELRGLFALLVAASLLGPWLALDIGPTLGRLDVSARDASLLFLVLGLGALITVVILASIRRLTNAGTWYGIALVAGAVLTAGISLANSYALVALLMFVYGLALDGRGILFRTLVQSRTPMSLVGRAMGTYFFVTAVGAALGALVSLVGRDVLRSEGWLIAAVIVLTGVTTLVLVRNPDIRRMPTHPDPAQPADEAAKAAPGAG